jgi:hypothetical protein
MGGLYLAEHPNSKGIILKIVNAMKAKFSQQSHLHDFKMKITYRFCHSNGDFLHK